MELDRTALIDADCWFSTDAVSRRPDITAFKRRARLQQARWRESKGLDKGKHSREGVDYPNGSKMAAVEANKYANFLSDNICEAVEHRLRHKEPHETLNEPRLRYDLLSSMPMCFNLFGELHGNPGLAQTAAAALWETPRDSAVEVRFEWSPGRKQTTYLNDRTAFDVAFLIGPPDQPRDFVGIETKYHEHAVPEAAPNPDTRLPRYLEVADRSGIFGSNWQTAVLGTELQQIWRDHLLVLAMLQHPDNLWRSGRYVLVHPEQNPSFREAADRYRSILTDDSTFEVMTVEELLKAAVLHSPETARAFEDRYLW